jgi:hypothetical protein
MGVAHSPPSGSYRLVGADLVRDVREGLGDGSVRVREGELAADVSAERDTWLERNPLFLDVRTSVPVQEVNATPHWAASN